MSTRTARRSACDGCHNAKSRCATGSGEGICQRCIRLKLNCTYSPHLRMGRPRKNRHTENVIETALVNDTDHRMNIDQSDCSRCKQFNSLVPREKRVEGMSTSGQDWSPYSDRGARCDAATSKPSTTSRCDTFSECNFRTTAAESSASSDDNASHVELRTTTNQSPSTPFQDFEDLVWHHSCEFDYIMSALNTDQNSKDAVDKYIPACFQEDALPSSVGVINGDSGSNMITSTSDDSARKATVPCTSILPSESSTRKVVQSPHKQSVRNNAAPETEGSARTASTMCDQIQEMLDENIHHGNFHERQLSRLHLDLLELNERRPLTALPSNAPAQHMIFGCIDEIFSATNALLDITQQILTQTFQNTTWRNSSLQSDGLLSTYDTDNIQASNQQSYAVSELEMKDSFGQTTAVTALGGMRKEMDPSTVMLVLTCYTRLLSIYRPLVTSLTTMLNQYKTAKHGLGLRTPPNLSLGDQNSESSAMLPTFSIGKFSLMGSPVMNMKLILDTVLRLLRQMHECIGSFIAAHERGNIHNKWTLSGYQTPITQPFRVQNRSLIASVGYLAVQEAADTEGRLIRLLEQSVGSDQPF